MRTENHLGKFKSRQFGANHDLNRAVPHSCPQTNILGHNDVTRRQSRRTVAFPSFFLR